MKRRRMNWRGIRAIVRIDLRVVRENKGVAIPMLAKLLSAWLPAIVVAWGGFLLYATVVNLAAWRTMGRVFFPNTMWVVLALWVAPAVAGLGLGATVLISSRAKGFQDAYQLGVIVVLPVLFLAIGQMSGAVSLDVRLVVLLGLFLWIVDGGLMGLGARTFRRDALTLRLQCGWA